MDIRSTAIGLFFISFYLGIFSFFIRIRNPNFNNIGFSITSNFLAAFSYLFLSLYSENLILFPILLANIFFVIATLLRGYVYKKLLINLLPGDKLIYFIIASILFFLSLVFAISLLVLIVSPTFQDLFNHSQFNFLLLICTMIVEINWTILFLFISIQRTTTNLIESEEKYRILFEQAAIGVAQIDTHTGKFIRINRKYSEIIGYTNEEMQNTNFLTITYPPDLPADLENMERLKKGEISEFTMEKRLFHKTGRLIWVELSVSAMWAKGAIPSFHIAVISDITQQKYDELKLKKLSIAVEQSPTTIVITDTDGKIEYVNPKFTELTGYTIQEAIGKNPRVLQSGKTPEHIFKELWLTIKAGKTWHGEIINKKKSGEVFIENTLIAPVFDTNQTIINFIAIKEDITNRKKAEDALKESELHLRELNATKDKFFNIIAHDLRNPFVGIMGLAEIMEQYLITEIKTDESELLKCVQMVKTSSKAAFDLLENLMQWARSQTGNISVNPENLSIRFIISYTLTIVSGNAFKKNITIEDSKVEDNTVYADNALLSTILRNLLTNAIKFTNQNGTITISTKKKDDFLEISITDTGVGMDSKNLDKIFRIDSKFSNLGTDKEKGTGLGLILCKEFVEKQGGTIWVESEVGKGSTFTFTLPLGLNDII